MQRIPLLPILCLLVLTASAYADPALVKKVEPSVVFIKTDKGLGSGLIVSKDKVVTNYHVIRGASKVDITFSGEDSPTFTSKGYHLIDEKRDIAVLSLKLTPGATADYMKPVKLAAKHPDKGEDVLAIGNPIGLDFSVSEGIVSAVRKAGAPDDMHLKNREGEWIQHTAAISGGNSGGPLFNMDGEVVGMNTLSFVVDNAQNLNFAISALDIAKVTVDASKTKVKDYSANEFDVLAGNPSLKISTAQLDSIKSILIKRINDIEITHAAPPEQGFERHSFRHRDAKDIKKDLFQPFDLPIIGMAGYAIDIPAKVKGRTEIPNYPCYWNNSYAPISSNGTLLRLFDRVELGRPFFIKGGRVFNLPPDMFNKPSNEEVDSVSGGPFVFLSSHRLKPGSVYGVAGKIVSYSSKGIIVLVGKSTLFVPYDEKKMLEIRATSRLGQRIEVPVFISSPIIVNPPEGKLAALVGFDLRELLDNQWFDEEVKRQSDKRQLAVKNEEDEEARKNIKKLFENGEIVKHEFVGKNGAKLEAYALEITAVNVTLAFELKDVWKVVPVPLEQLVPASREWLNMRKDYIESLGPRLREEIDNQRGKAR